jgi:hypothetical protein
VVEKVEDAKEEVVDKVEEAKEEVLTEVQGLTKDVRDTHNVTQVCLCTPSPPPPPPPPPPLPPPPAQRSFQLHPAPSHTSARWSLTAAAAVVRQKRWEADNARREAERQRKEAEKHARGDRKAKREAKRRAEAETRAKAEQQAEHTRLLARVAAGTARQVAASPAVMAQPVRAAVTARLVQPAAPTPTPPRQMRLASASPEPSPAPSPEPSPAPSSEPSSEPRQMRDADPPDCEALAVAEAADADDDESWLVASPAQQQTAAATTRQTTPASPPSSPQEQALALADEFDELAHDDGFDNVVGDERLLERAERVCACMRRLSLLSEAAEAAMEEVAAADSPVQEVAEAAMEEVAAEPAVVDEVAAEPAGAAAAPSALLRRRTPKVAFAPGTPAGPPTHERRVLSPLPVNTARRTEREGRVLGEARELQQGAAARSRMMQTPTRPTLHQATTPWPTPRLAGVWRLMLRRRRAADEMRCALFAMLAQTLRAMPRHRPTPSRPTRCRPHPLRQC